MVTRYFLGWDRPFVSLASEWLLERSEQLPGTMVIVPTSQAGRQLRHQLVIQSTALLSPRILTPGALLATPDPDIASPWTECLAWQEVLEAQTSWSPDLFPHAPEHDGEWAGGLASELGRLRRTLQENGLTLQQASRMLGQSMEAGRWQALAELEQQMEQKLRQWGYRSRSRVLANGLILPQDIDAIVLAGVTEIPPLLERSILSWPGPVASLIGAPETEAAGFSETGIPLESWSTAIIPWPDATQGSVTVTADTRQQAEEARLAIASAGSAVADVALGTADSESGDILRDVFTRAGWPAFHPASIVPPAGIRRWLMVWADWLQDPKLATLADLLALPQSAALIDADRAVIAEHLSRLRNDCMVMRPDDLRHRIQHQHFPRDQHRAIAMQVLKVVETFEQWRAMLLRKDFHEPMKRFLDTLSVDDASALECLPILAWFDSAAPLIRQIDRSSKFWIKLMLSDLPDEPPAPPDDRVIDIQGWLELYFEPGSHLVLCGLNEGKVPANAGSDPWLGEAAKSFLGLNTDARRAARDALLLRSMTASRMPGGRINLICARSKPNGEPMLPSRLLLAAPDDELPRRVQHLFREIEPPDAKLRWHADWKWQPQAHAMPGHISATALKDYLACPFRFYLKHLARMRETEPDRIEWNARDFGNVAHQILDRWGKDESARDSSDAGEIHRWVSAELDRVVREWFGERIPLAVRIQTESLRQRLGWFARIQAQTRAGGWQVLHTEQRFEIDAGPIRIHGVIDRIDHHAESDTWRVIDYKTGKEGSVVSEHQSRIGSSTRLPAHLGEDGPAVYTKTENTDKPQATRWTNLQLPLYAAAMRQEQATVLAVPCYFKLGETESDVKLDAWETFGEEDLDAAIACANWIVSQIHQGIFSPPAEKITYDDLDALSYGKPVDAVFHPIPTACGEPG